MINRIVFLLVFLLAACQPMAPAPTPTPATLSAQQIIDRLIAAGLEVSDVKPLARPEGMPEHYQFKERMGFAIAEIAPDGGQVYTCEVRPHCDLLMELFKTFEDLAGKYYYLLPDGLAVVQLDIEVSPETAKRFEDAVKGIK